MYLKYNKNKVARKKKQLHGNFVHVINTHIGNTLDDLDFMT